MKLPTEQDNPMLWFQPIVDTADSRVFAHQCLFANSAPRETESAMRGLALATRGVAGRRKNGIYFVDVSLSAPPSVLDLGQPGSIVCQLRLSDPTRQLSYLFRLKEIYASDRCSMALTVQNADQETMEALDGLRPHYLKLHQTLVRSVEHPRCASAIRKLMEFADERGLTVIAEGVRNAEGMENLWLMGVRNMQGDVFGPPDMAMFPLQNDHSMLVNPVCDR